MKGLLTPGATSQPHPAAWDPSPEAQALTPTPPVVPVSTAVTPYPSSHPCQNLGSSLESSSRFPSPLPSGCLSWRTVLSNQASVLQPRQLRCLLIWPVGNPAPSCSSFQPPPPVPTSKTSRPLGPSCPVTLTGALTPQLKSKLPNMLFEALPQA